MSPRALLNAKGLRWAIAHVPGAIACREGLRLPGGALVRVRVAKVSTVPRRVKVAGKVYRYTYPALVYNLNVHKRKVTAEWWLLIGILTGKRMAWMVPGRKMTGKTRHVLLGTRAQRNMDKWRIA